MLKLNNFVLLLSLSLFLKALQYLLPFYMVRYHFRSYQITSLITEDQNED